MHSRYSISLKGSPLGPCVIFKGSISSVTFQPIPMGPGLDQRRVGGIMMFTACQRSDEGNVFSRVCPLVILFTCSPCTKFCSPGIFKIVHLGLHCTAPPFHLLDMFKQVHYEAQTVSKWLVGIQLKYLLACLAMEFNEPTFRPYKLQHSFKL